MTTPNPLAPVKGATTTLWIYSGSETHLLTHYRMLTDTPGED